jgi:putative tryptophan/tyrosine transport system substrate-binding protein
VDGIYAWGSPLLRSNLEAVAELAIAAKMPVMTIFREFTRRGFLISNGPNVVDLMRRAGGYVAKILNGAKPPDLPVEQPEKFTLVINLKTANALGLAVPKSLLARADEVIE